MAPDSDTTKLALDDVRNHMKGLLDAVLSADRQAMTLMGYYLSIAAGCGGGLIASSSTNARVPVAGVLALIAILSCVLAGAACCLIAMRRSRISMPGREAGFWVWAGRPDVDAQSVYEAYLERAQEGLDLLKATNSYMACWLERARWCGFCTPFVALILAAFAL